MSDIVIRLSKRNVRRAFTAVGTAALFAAGFGVARADVPADVDALVYAGVLEEDGVLVDGERALRVELFDVDTAGTPRCFAEDQTASVIQGRFRIAMPDCADDIRSATEVFAEVKVAGETVGTRTRIGAVPFALEAGRADVAATTSPGGVGTVQLADGAVTGPKLADDTIPAVGPWQAYSPSFVDAAGVSIPSTSVEGAFRRVGDSVEIGVFVTMAAQTGAVDRAMRFTLPAGVTVNDAAVLGGGAPLGFGLIVADQNAVAVVSSASPTSVSMIVDGSLIGATTRSPFVLDAANDSVRLHFTVPVEGFNATVP